MDEATPLTEIPLSNSNQAESGRKSPHLDTTYGRYERAPFRQYSERKASNQAPLVEQPRRLPSKDSLLRRVLSRQSRLEQRVFGGGQQGDVSQSKSTVNRKRSGRRPQPNYSLAGPRQEPQEWAPEGSGRRPKPQWGLGEPFPHGGRKGKNGGSSSDNHPQGQVSYLHLSSFLTLY